jgi:signal transduction histidine kinase/FixJ family two-component response regulator/HAMP domain-containing protein
MKLQTKILFIIVPVIVLFIGGFGWWIEKKIAQGFNRTALQYVEGVLHTYVSQDVARRHELLVENRLENIASFVKMYQNEAIDATSRINLAWPGYFLVFDNTGRMVSSRSEEDEKKYADWHKIAADILESKATSGHKHLKRELFSFVYFPEWKWYIFLVVGYDDMHAAIEKVRYATITLTLGSAILILLILSLFFRNIIIKPINLLRMAASDISGQKHVKVINLATSDELGVLARDIEKMSAQLHTARKEMQKLNEGLEATVEERTDQLIRKNQALIDEVGKRVQAQQQIRHLNHVLKAIRDVNQLIVKEKQQHLLMEKACQILIQTKAYMSAWIILVDESRQFASMAEAGLGRTGAAMQTYLESSEGSEYLQRLLKLPADQIFETDFKQADKLNHFQAFVDRKILYLKLSHEQTLFGFLAVSMDSQSRINDEEHSLLLEVAGDIAFALHGIKTEKERQQAETARENMERQLSQARKMEAIGTLAGGIAHDFNNILTVILGYAEILMQENENNEAVCEDLGEIVTASQRAKDLVYQILTFARKSTDELAPLRVGPVVEDAVKFLRSTLPSTIRIKKMILSQTLINGNSTQIHQVVINLGINAAHAMEKMDGSLKIGMEEVVVGTPRKVYTGDLNAGTYARITVKDSGTGIDPGIIDFVFEPYFTTKKKGDGTGLGLAMVHGIVKSHDGEIDIKSRPGAGTLFSIYIPVITTADHRPPFTTAPLPTGTERLLLVDDEPAIVKTAETMLTQLGYRVDGVTCSVEALERFRSRPDDYDLVITDRTMPDLTGEKLAAELIKIREDIPVILCSGFLADTCIDKLRSSGIRALVNKPLERREWATTVRRVLDEAAQNPSKSSATALEVVRIFQR